MNNDGNGLNLNEFYEQKAQRVKDFHEGIVKPKMQLIMETLNELGEECKTNSATIENKDGFLPKEFDEYIGKFNPLVEEVDEFFKEAENQWREKSNKQGVEMEQTQKLFLQLKEQIECSLFVVQPAKNYVLKKLPKYGSNSNPNFEWPKSLEDLCENVKDLRNLQLKQIIYQVGSGTTGDMFFEFTNGVKSASMLKNKLTSAEEKLEFDLSKRIKKVRTLCNDSCFNQFEFIYDDDTKVQTKKYYEQKNWHEYDITEDMVVVGAYGYATNNYFMSFGLIVLAAE